MPYASLIRHTALTDEPGTLHSIRTTFYLSPPVACSVSPVT